MHKDVTVAPWRDFKGLIMLYDVKNPQKAPQPLKIRGENIDLQHFNPHGISVWQENSKYMVTYAVLSRKDTSTKARVCPTDRAFSTGGTWNLFCAYLRNAYKHDSIRY